MYVCLWPVTSRIWGVTRELFVFFLSDFEGVMGVRRWQGEGIGVVGVRLQQVGRGAESRQGVRR